MKSYIIKKKFLKYFKSNGYVEIQESSLIPIKDNSILFTNSGMVQFKNIFLGLEKIKYKKIVTSQTCVRLGGKHNDLDTIGESVHHNTSFTMLGNFCFKDASKKEAIILAWNFLINILLLEKNKLFVTVHENDFESFDIWSNIIKIDISHIQKGSDETNFWSMDDVGPCGYCSEIFYNISDKNIDLLEIWNLVFMQFEKKNEKLEELNDLFIDTGMGLERITSIKQGIFDNFKTDILKNLVNSVKKFFNTENEVSSRIITDHLKTCILLILQGLYPANFGRGYILKKLIRRIIIKKKELKSNFCISDLLDDFIYFLNNKLTNQTKNIVKNIIQFEENKFEQTLNNGINFLYESINNKKEINGKILFKLHDTYGVPLYVLKNILEKNVIDKHLYDFNIEMENQIKISKKKILDIDDKYNLSNLEKTIFRGYESNFIESEIVKIIKNEKFCDFAIKNDDCIIILKSTCFYPEKGGQIGDSGKIENLDSVFEVFDTKDFNGFFFHIGKILNGSFFVGEKVSVKIDVKKRNLISVNHSATHLLHSALKNILGDSVKQSGSLINDDYLRFDFTYFGVLSNDDIQRIEDFVNDCIKLNLKTKIKILNTDSDLEKNRLVFFSNNISKEFCAGTHVENSRDIRFFKIIKEFSIGANIRRIEAVTGDKLRFLLNKNDEILNNLSKKLNTQKDNLSKFIDLILNKNKILQKNNDLLMLENMNFLLNNSDNQKFLLDIKIIFIEKEYSNIFKDSIFFLNKTIVVFYNFKDKNIFININISNDIFFIDASEIIKNLKNNFKIKGGGNNKFASGVIFYNNINDIINNVYSYIEFLGKKN